MDQDNRILDMLLNALDYKNSANFFPSPGGDFDAEYCIVVDGEKYTVVGIKVMDAADEKAVIEQHLLYWNKNEVPFSIMILPEELRIYNNFSSKKKNLLYSSKDEKKDKAVLELFSDENILSGKLWERLSKIISKSERVDSDLLANLRNVILGLHNDYAMPVENAYNFLAQCIFIKYLEDRDMLTQNTFMEFHAGDFNELLALKDTAALRGFFVMMKEKFNGDLFDMTDEQWPDSGQIAVIKSFFDGDLLYQDGNRQLSMFRYDFSVIPIELISNIYETFFKLADSISGRKDSAKIGAYYTPYYLADFMNNQCFHKIPKSKRNIVILDPACGSGVFLVGAFKRLVEREKAQNGRIDKERLKDIIVNNIKGIDLNERALKITCFSLYIALAEYLTPKDLTENDFQFPNLINHSLYTGSFFEKKLEDIVSTADIIIGNPPWASDKSGDHNLYCKERNIPISDGQIAQAFIARASDFADTETVVSLLVTNSIFTNENPRQFRKYILDTFQLLEIFNLDNIKNSLFAHASAPCSILSYRVQRSEEDYKFAYYSFRSNMLSELLKKIIYDQLEIKKISRRVIREKDYIWLVLVNGDEYDVRVISKLKTNPPLKCTVDEKDGGLICFRGFAKANGRNECPKFLEYKGGNLKEGFQKYLIDYEALPQIKECNYERPRDLGNYLYKNKILIKRTFNSKLWGAAFCEEPVIFCDDYHCIADTKGDLGDYLKFIEALFNSKVFMYYCYYTSKIAVGIKPEISKDNLLSLPIPKSADKAEIAFFARNIERIEQILKAQYERSLFDEDRQIVNEQEICKIQDRLDQRIYELYDLDDIDIAVIEYATNCVIPSLGSRRKGIAYADDQSYLDYAGCIENYFNNFLYSQGRKIVVQNKFSKHLYTAMIFIVIKLEEDPGNAKIQNEYLKSLPDILGLCGLDNINGELVVKKRLSGFTQNGFFVIKTREYKNWTVMSAIKDAEYFMKIIFEDTKGGGING